VVVEAAEGVPGHLIEAGIDDVRLTRR
jgi:hypothetical protein